MLFEGLRITLFLIISIFIFFIIRKTNIVRKKLVSILSIILCMVVISISGIFPINNIINFTRIHIIKNTFWRVEINKYIFYGKESCMIIYAKGKDPVGYYIIPKSENGYKIPNYYSTKKVSHKFDSLGIFDVFNANGTNDYYIYGLTVSKDNSHNIIDSNNNDIKSFIVENGKTDTKTIILYAFVEDFKDDYFLLINGEKILLSN